ncbi:MAG: DUF1761 domain-containing protein [Candidatus Eremiobacteraeota bacterium]|nr:DUF1761 domain-containing protein [Candidatus Eremiobacteraeota bacterium]MBV8263842.1 DUF1761 domain-containing protein [Candidatus Eremiobacteraeota bacterium]MBV8461305.1 DUF1761 domain-containing protein [Candidatus Eremiobacteraeota bacterium]MBV8595284.1 DUF1761 domain-containing protein [Candidatus Eremiobacteraeota bacterium]MBV8669693.1 DUF1761 domain-containing protein [Candidatus Eremiobacteraeota bacterium]
MASKINHAAVWVAAIAFFFWGYVWFSVLFKAQTMAMLAASGSSMTPSGPTPYIVGFLMALVLGYGTAVALADSSTPTAAHGISFGLFMGIVFYASVTLTSTLFAGRELGSWLLNVGWALIGFAIVGAIVGGWRKKLGT